MPTWSLLILVGYLVTCYGAVGTHPTGMLTCIIFAPGLKLDGSPHFFSERTVVKKREFSSVNLILYLSVIAMATAQLVRITKSQHLTSNKLLVTTVIKTTTTTTGPVTMETVIVLTLTTHSAGLGYFDKHVKAMLLSQSLDTFDLFD